MNGERRLSPGAEMLLRYHYRDGSMQAALPLRCVADEPGRLVAWLAPSTGWYLNFEAPAIRSGSRLDSVDWHLDLWVDHDGSPSWKDEEEASYAVAAGHLTASDLATARAVGTFFAADVDRLLELIGDWRAFVPLAAWLPMHLPDDWAT